MKNLVYVAAGGELCYIEWLREKEGWVETPVTEKMRSIHRQGSATADLIARLKANDPAAQRIFWKAHFDDVYATCASVLGDGLPANETAVEVLAEFLVRRVHSLAHPAATRSYLRLMASRRALKSRELLNRPVYAEMDSFLGEAGVGGEDAILLKQLLPRLERCLAKLPVKAQQVLKLRYREELTNEKIGSLLGGSKQYIGRLIGRCLQRLRRCVKKKAPR